MFLHALGLRLGKSLQELSELSPEELESWRTYYSIYPFDDMHTAWRPTSLIASALSGAKPDEAMDFLIPGWDDGITDSPEDVAKAFSQ